MLVNITTDKCYENREWFWGYREEDTLGGHDPYSSSKACSEILTACYRRSFFSGGSKPIGVATARAGNIIGGGDWAESRIVPDCFRSFLKNEPVILRSPSSVRPWQHVLDPLHGYLQLARALHLDSKTFDGPWNFGPLEDSRASVSQLVSGLIEKGKEKYGQYWRMEVNPQTAVYEAKQLTLDCSKANQLLGWRPIWNLDRSLDETLEWYWLVHKGQNTTAITHQQVDRFFSDAKRVQLDKLGCWYRG